MVLTTPETSFPTAHRSSTHWGEMTVSPELLQKYSTSGPRYTSYPTVPEWTESVDAKVFTKALLEFKATGSPKTPVPLSLYTHIPFCAERCLFCGCNVVITKQTDQAEKYLPYLFRDMDRLAQHRPQDHQVTQLHWGGGTPTYLSPEQLIRVFKHQTKEYQLAPDAEVSLEVDPRVTTLEQLQTLRGLGFNRISMGVQDFDATVQAAVNRIQPFDQTAQLITDSRTLGFDSVNIDLIYGLPHQTLLQFERTLEQVLTLAPDRLALYHFAYVPWISPHQKALDEASLPDSSVKFQIFAMALETLTQAGYVYIGMDHFAKPTDELATALQDGTLHRNFMGYTTRGGSQMLSSGVSAISALNTVYAQNQRKLADYYAALDADQHPTMRGYVLTDDDQLHRQVIQDLLCQGRVDFDLIDTLFGVDTATRFAALWPALAPMVNDGLLTLTPDSEPRHIQLTPLGRIFSRNIAMVFDPYFAKRQSSSQPLFSKTV